MNEEHRSIQLEQKIIHLKSELEKYKTMLASFQSDQQSNHLQEQMEQLTNENAQLQEKCHDYEETISTQNHEIDRLLTELEETKKENRLLHNEIEEVRNENLILQKKVETNEEKIQSLLSDLSNYKQRMEQLTNENTQLQEKCHDYKETISTQNHKIDRLLTELEETKKENRLLHNEIEEVRNENLILQKKEEANEEKIQSLLSDLSNYKQRMEQLTNENTQLQEKCHDYKETISTQNHEIDRLSTELEETKKENCLLHDEIEEVRSENLILQKKVEVNEEKIQSLLKDAAASKQRQAELEKEKEIMKEKTRSLERELSSHRALMNEYLSFKSELESFTSWVERIKTMEKDYDFLKENSDKVLRDFEELKNILFTQKLETEDLREEVRTLTKKFRVIEEKLSEIDREKQKDLLVLQKNILHQQIEMEAILEKTVRFSKEIEKISKQLSELTERMDQKRGDSSNPEMNEMKEILSQLVQLLTTQQETPHVEEKPKEITPSQKNPVTTSFTNSFLKLQEFIDETKQQIVISPVKKKGQNQLNSQTSNVYPQRFSQIKHVRIEPQNTRQPFRDKQPGEDDDKSPNPVTPTQLYTATEDDHSDTQLLTLDIPKSTTELRDTTEEEPITSKCMEEKVSEQWITHQAMSKQTEEEIHYDIEEEIHYDMIDHTAVQEEENENIDSHEILEEMKSENQETEDEHFMKKDETNVSSPAESTTASIMVENVQETLDMEINSSSDKEIQATPLNPLAELTYHDEPAKTASKTQDTVSRNEITFLKEEDKSIEEDLENKKRGLFSLLKKVKIFE
ncbi:hypothetical protein HT574_08490 [Parageobacillus sp. VR-IP]|uniref:hypothetical protein n=1 Tax=Parageobacillus sp. VR-IP TaxID=2742205 RepID=UPI001581B0FA|nr:hypothetical protein [Parageobacillus sp. VR-IP]NUK30128.1 hypothetical protein [Parageobacillus sp. VR-IP]